MPLIVTKTSNRHLPPTPTRCNAFAGLSSRMLRPPNPLRLRAHIAPCPSAPCPKSANKWDQTNPIQRVDLPLASAQRPTAIVDGRILISSPLRTPVTRCRIELFSGRSDQGMVPRREPSTNMEDGHQHPFRARSLRLSCWSARVASLKRDSPNSAHFQGTQAALPKRVSCTCAGPAHVTIAASSCKNSWLRSNGNVAGRR